MQPNDVFSYSNQVITGMSGFTSDFFGALQTTFTDNSLNNSKCDLSQSNPNKSQILREIKEQNMIKIAQKLTKMIQFIAFEQIYAQGVRRQRRANRNNQMNQKKIFYRIELTLNMKIRSRITGAFHRVFKFTENLDMPNPALIPQPLRQQSMVPSSPNQLIQQLIAINEKLKYKNIDFAFSKLKNQQKTNVISNRQNIAGNQKYNITAIDKILNYNYNIRLGFRKIQNYQYFLNKKAYLIQCLAVSFNKQMRLALMSIYNEYKIKALEQNIQKQKDLQRQLDQKQAAKKKQSQKSLISQKINLKQTNAQSYGLQSRIKFKKAGKSNGLQVQVNSIQKIQSDNNIQTPTKVGRPKSGLKFNRCIKKKSQQGQKHQQPKQSKSQKLLEQYPLLKTKSSVTVKQAKQIKNAMLNKAVKVLTVLDEPKLPTIVNWTDFSISQKTYHLTPQEMRDEVPDMQDKLVNFEDSMSASRSSSLGQKLTFSKRIHRLDNKKPLEFSNKKTKSKQSSSSKSKKSVVKSEDQQYQNMNFQSLKSYYFPQQQTFGKAVTGNGMSDRQYSTKYIGSNNWAGQSKKRVTTEVNLRVVKSNQKINPYLQQLKQKTTKKPIQRKGSNKNSERSLSGRSSSKISKQQQKRLQQNYQTNVNSRQQSNLNTRNVTPRDGRQNQPNKNLPPVPRQWHFYHSSSPNIASPAHPTSDIRYQKSPLQFQRIVSKNNKH